VQHTEYFFREVGYSRYDVSSEMFQTVYSTWITVARESSVRSIFNCSDIRVVGSNLSKGMDVCLLLSASVVLWGRSPIQKVLVLELK
jgi:hypothetical protein